MLAATDWWRGRRDRATRLAGFAVAIGLLVLATPGFRAGRSFVGVHEETLSGSLVIVWRLLLGNDAQIVDSAGALYVAAGGWALLLNLVVGSAIAMAALTVLRRSFSRQGAVALTGSRPGQILLTAAAFISVHWSVCGRRRRCGGTPDGWCEIWCWWKRRPLRFETSG